MSSSCPICKLDIEEDKDDYVSLQGSCTHKLHLGCWKDSNACFCSPPQGLLSLEETINDPLQILTKEEEMPPPEAGALTRLWGMFTKKIDSAVETNACNLIRQGVSVAILREKGYNAEAIVAEDPKIVPLMANNYSAAQMLTLGFTWKLLLRGGLTQKTFSEVYKEWGISFFEKFVSSLEDLLELCSQDISQLPDLHVSPQDLSLKLRASDLIKAGLTPVSFLQFGFSVEEWYEILGLRDISFLDPATIEHWKNQEGNKAAFEHYFPLYKDASHPIRPTFKNRTTRGPQNRQPIARSLRS